MPPVAATSTPRSSQAAYESPLSQRDFVLTTIRPDADYWALKAREDSFVNDAVKTHVYNYPRKIPIIPKYDALHDPQCAKYFEGPTAQEAVRVNRHGESPREKKRGKNKMSSRDLCLQTPPPDLVTSREQEFVNDAVPAEKRRTKYKDTLLTPYKAEEDSHCKGYFERPDVHKLISKTRPELHLSSSTSSSSMSSEGDNKSLGSQKSNRSQACSPMRRNKLKSESKESFATSERDPSPTRRGRNASPDRSRQRNRSPERRHGKENGSPTRSSVYNDSSPDRSFRSSYHENCLSVMEPFDDSKPLSRYRQMNKMSARYLSVPTPPADRIRERELMFVNDAIITEKQRTKYKDTLLPPYNALEDPHSSAHFVRQGMPKLIKMTTTVKPWEPDLKVDLLKTQRKFEEIERKKEEQHHKKHGGGGKNDKQ